MLGLFARMPAERKRALARFPLKASPPALNRREFLRSAAVAALAASSPALLRAQDKAGHAQSHPGFGRAYLRVHP